MAAGPEALRGLLKDIERLETLYSRVSQTLREEHLLPAWWDGNPWADAPEPWDPEITAAIWKRIVDRGQKEAGPSRL